MTLPTTTEPQHVVGICGGAVAGSEAAALVAERGALALVFEQNARPYGKIEDGLPRWHEKLRHAEYAKIDENLSKPGVIYVPRTRLGEDIGFPELSTGLGLSSLVLAHGAWRDRPLAIDGVDEYVDQGLVYQNAFVYWFNHYPEAGYDGPVYDVPDGAIVVGGGLASVDVVKIISLELYAKALRARGIEVDQHEMEARGIPKVCEKHGIDPADLGVRGCTLYYRRRNVDMPLTDMDPKDDAHRAKLEGARVKIMDKLLRKFLVSFEECCMPVGTVVEDGRLAGLVFRRTEIVDRRVVPLEGTDFEARGDMVISSIGSIPMPIEGIPMKGELYAWKDWDTGELCDGVYGLGNVLTGKGNIKSSRENAREIASQVVDKCLARPKLEADQVRVILDLVKKRWDEVGYTGDYAAWMKSVTPPDMP